MSLHVRLDEYRARGVSRVVEWEPVDVRGNQSADDRKEQTDLKDGHGRDVDPVTAAAAVAAVAACLGAE